MVSTDHPDICHVAYCMGDPEDCWIPAVNYDSTISMSVVMLRNHTY